MSQYGRLVDEAKKAMNNAYSPYSGVKVGAALLDTKGSIFTGCNVENSSFSLTICAERVAAVKAVSAGSTNFLAIAIISNLPSFTYPCGACRQFLSEFSQDMTVLLISSENKKATRKLRTLLPNTFKLVKKNL